MKYLFVLLLLISSSVFSQASKVLIADETFLVRKEKSFTIECSNENINKLIIRDLQGKFKAMRISQKKDRKGTYWLYNYTFPQESYNDMVSFINRINKS